MSKAKVCFNHSPLQAYHASAHYQKVVFLRLTQFNYLYVESTFSILCSTLHSILWFIWPTTTDNMNQRTVEQQFTWYCLILLLNAVSILEVYASLTIVLVGYKFKQILSRWWKKVVWRGKIIPHVPQRDWTLLTNDIHSTMSKLLQWTKLSVKLSSTDTLVEFSWISGCSSWDCPKYSEARLN